MHRLLSRTRVFIYSVDKPEDLTSRLGLSNPVRLWQMFPSASKLVLWNINRDRVTRAKAETAKEFSRSVMSQARLAHARRGSLQYGGNNDAINCRRVFFARSRNRSTPKFLRPICSFGNNGALSERLRYPGHLDTDNDRLAFPTGKQRETDSCFSRGATRGKRARNERLVCFIRAKNGRPRALPHFLRTPTRH